MRILYRYIFGTPEDPCLGQLYNWAAVDDSRKITSSDDWIVPTNTQVNDLGAYIGASLGAFEYSGGGGLKEVGLSFWQTPNTDATNIYGFNGRGTGKRTNSGIFGDKDQYFSAWTSSALNSSFSYNYSLAYDSGSLHTYNYPAGSAAVNTGNSIRLVKDATGIADGVKTIYIGNDNKEYEAIAINQLYWTTINLEETLYRNLDPIPEITDNTQWANLSTGARCFYNNDGTYGCKEDVCFGYLYNFYTIEDARNLANTGWHVPTESEVNTLLTFLGGGSTAGAKLRDDNVLYWTPGSDASNLSGFSAKGNGILENELFYNLKLAFSMYTSDYSDPFVKVLGIDRFNTTFIGNGFGKNPGRSIRLLKDSTTLSDGETGTYIGNDGKVYNTICIGTQEWLSEDLEETQYRNNDNIPYVDDVAEWDTLTSGALCIYDNNISYACKLPTPKTECYGYLYNWYAAVDAREITSSATWTVPTQAQRDALRTHIGLGSASGGELKEVGTLRWVTSVGANDTYGFAGIGAGFRNPTGDFSNLRITAKLMVSDQFDATRMTGWQLIHTSNNWSNIADLKEYGWSIRLVADATGVPDSTPTSYTGNDGKVYKAVAIGGVYWLAENLEETQFRNGDPIPHTADTTDWTNLTTAGVCIYDNDITYACKTPLPISTISYGYIYNTYAVEDANLTQSGWHVMDSDDWYAIVEMLLGRSLQASDYQVFDTDGIYTLREPGTTRWDTDLGTNETNFTFVGGAERDNNGFSDLKNVGHLLCRDDNAFGGKRYISWVDNFDHITFTQIGGGGQYLANGYGATTRVVKDTTDLQNDGDTGIYVGNDGKIYETVRIAGKEFTTKNLAETKWRNGTDINISDAWSNAAWLALGTAAACPPNNNYSNV